MATKSKFFRVVLEGATTDGRTIDRQAIQQMADNFDPQVYGARVWMEHLRSMTADSPFKAYGDVVAVKAEEVDIGGTKKLALFAQIEPTPALIAMNKDRQKIYTSVEINPKFSDTGEAYLVGLGVTDSPASLGTEVLTFAAKNPTVNPFTARKLNADNLFSEALEVTLEFEDGETKDSALTARVKSLVKRFTGKNSGDDARVADLTQAVELLLSHVEERDQQFASATGRIKKLEADLQTANTAFVQFKTQMDAEDGNKSVRPPATGGSGDLQTDF